MKNISAFRLLALFASLVFFAAASVRGAEMTRADYAGIWVSVPRSDPMASTPGQLPRVFHIPVEGEAQGSFQWNGLNHVLKEFSVDGDLLRFKIDYQDKTYPMIAARFGEGLIDVWFGEKRDGAGFFLARKVTEAELARLIAAAPATPEFKPQPLPPLRKLPANNLARTPPLGWNSWNAFRDAIDDKTIREMADLLVSTGLRDAGYNYINIDDGWQGHRDDKGVLHPNSRFPDMKALADYVHSKGLLFGIYSGPGPVTCAGYLGSHGFEEQDAKTFAAWGVDLLKHDWCSAGTLYESKEDMQALYQKMGEALQSTGRPIVYSLCQYGLHDVSSWGREVGGHLWRTGADTIEGDLWKAIDHRFDHNGNPDDAGPGGWNDADMMLVGLPGLTAEEYRTHMTLWVISASPIILGHDLRTMTPEDRALLTNREVLAVNQDPKGIQGRRVVQNGTTEVWTKPLADKGLAVALFNRGDAPAEVAATWTELGLPGASAVRDLWRQTDVALSPDGLRAKVPAHGSVLFRVRPSDHPNPAVIPVPQPGMDARHEAKVKAASAHRYDLLMIGDSITHGLEDANFRAVWDYFYGSRNVLNLGFGGGRTENILWNLSNGQLDHQSPKVVTLLIGTNNSDDANYPVLNTPEQIFEGTKAIVDLLRQKLPDAKILVLRIFPRGGTYYGSDGSVRGSEQRRSEVGLRAGELCKSLADGKHVFYLDLNKTFLKSDGMIDKKLMPDELHPNPAGALAWARAMEPTLAKLFGDEPRGTSGDRWLLGADGAITWSALPGEKHKDFYQMAGEQLDAVVRYEVDDKGEFNVSLDVNWPMLRFEPKSTGNHLLIKFGSALNVPIQMMPFDEWWAPHTKTLHQAKIDGRITFEGTYNAWTWPILTYTRTIFPSVTGPAVFDTTTVKNNVPVPVSVAVDDLTRTIRTDAARGTYGGYHVTARVLETGIRKLEPGESTTFTVVYEAHKGGEPLLIPDVAAELQARESRLARIRDHLQLETPDPILNAAFTFAKIRAVECIYRTKGGLMHGPSDGRKYYAAIWANDQAEYNPPFFGMLGDPLATEAAANAFRHFARFMNPDYNPIPSSIIAEGDGTWAGAGDRGDMAMIAYGAGRFALALGDRKAAEEVWPLIEWCLEYLHRKVNAQGVITSDSDELEGRFPTGKANLSTSALAYDALRSAALLGRDLGKSPELLRTYEQRATDLRAAIERHFGAEVRGFHTYRYYDKAEMAGHHRFAKYVSMPDVLRAWIALPLTVDIFDRAQGTIDALFSPRLWTEDGLASEEGQETFWDRATLYGLRGVVAAGETKRGLDHLEKYSRRRLLGDHVPYPFEAYPEGDKAQLSAEGALYCRIYTEGFFGLRPTGLRSFELTPRLPDGWPSMALRNVHAFGAVFDLEVARGADDQLSVRIKREGKPDFLQTLAHGATITVSLP